MSAIIGGLRLSENRASFWCPGCNEPHTVNINESRSWGFNGSPEKPTFTPSVKVTNGHYVDWHKAGDSCWCTYNAECIAKGEEPSTFTCGICHSFVTDGRIQFLSDCSHALAGQTVDLPPYPQDEGKAP